MVEPWIQVLENHEGKTNEILEEISPEPEDLHEPQWFFLREP